MRMGPPRVSASTVVLRVLRPTFPLANRSFPRVRPEPRRLVTLPSGRYERNVGVGGDDAASARAWCDEHGEAPAAHAGWVPVGTAGARMAWCRGFCCRQGVTGGLRPAAGPAAATVVDDRRESRDRCTASVSCGLAGDGRTRRRPAADGRTEPPRAGWWGGLRPQTARGSGPVDGFYHRPAGGRGDARAGAPPMRWRRGTRYAWRFLLLVLAGPG